MSDKSAHEGVDRALAGLGAGHYGVFALIGAVNRGVNRDQLSYRVAAGRLWRLHQGVYSLVPPRLLKAEGRWLAAVLACGPDAALSHTNAAALWGIRAIPSGPIHVTVPARSGRKRRPGITVHRSSTLLVRRGIPVTDVRRTVADLRRTLPAVQVRSVIRRAEKRRLDIGPQPEHVADPDRTRLERRFQAVCRRHGLPEPQTQQVIGPYTVDFLWLEHRLIVEVDGWETHGTRSAFEDDRARDAWLTASGYRVLRFTWRQVTQQGAWVAQTVRTALDA